MKKKQKSRKRYQLAIVTVKKKKNKKVQGFGNYVILLWHYCSEWETLLSLFFKMKTQDEKKLSDSAKVTLFRNGQILNFLPALGWPWPVSSVFIFRRIPRGHGAGPGALPTSFSSSLYIFNIFKLTMSLAVPFLEGLDLDISKQSLLKSSINVARMTVPLGSTLCHFNTNYPNCICGGLMTEQYFISNQLAFIIT